MPLNHIDDAIKIAQFLQQKLPLRYEGWLLEARARFKQGKAEQAKQLALKAKGLEHFDFTWWPLMRSQDLLDEIEGK